MEQNINKLISIIIPTYNVENYISRGLESCINQTYKNIEIIVVDDGSIDNTCKVVEEYIKKDNRIFLYKKDNSGVSATRNLGIHKAKGDYCIYLDSDDWLNDSAIEILVNNIDDNDLVMCSYSNYINGEIKEARYYNPLTLSKNHILLCASKKEYHLDSSCFKLFDLNIIKNNHIYFDEAITNIEDGLFVFNYLHYIRKAKYIDGSLWIVNKREGSVTSKPFSESRLTCINAIHKMINDFNNSYDTHQNLLLNLACTLRYVIISMFYSNNKGKYKKLIKKYKKELRETIKLKEFPYCSLYDLLTFLFFGYIPYFLLNPFMKLWKKARGRV